MALVSAMSRSAVGQFVVVGSLVSAEALLVDRCADQRGHARPTRMSRQKFGREDFDRMRRIGLGIDPQAQARAVEEAAVDVEPRGAHRVVVCTHFIAKHQWLTRRAIDFPCALVELRDADVAATLLRVEALQVLGELTNQIAARNPHR
jgi:hypothetical protein